MIAKVFNTQDEANTWNNSVAVSKGCKGVTSYWHPSKVMSNDKVAVIVDSQSSTLPEDNSEGYVVLNDSDFPVVEQV